MVYIVQEAGKVCPSCSAVLGQEFEYCTGCGEFVGDHCEGCQRRLSSEWTFCPHCGHDAAHDAAHEAEGAEVEAKTPKPKRRRAKPATEELRKAS